jgi:hypothetical protein
MDANAQRSLLIAWLALGAVTLLSWWIGSGAGRGEPGSSALVTYGVLLIAAVKVRVIIQVFMEARHAPLLLRRLTDGWIVALVVALLAIYSLELGMPAV